MPIIKTLYEGFSGLIPTFFKVGSYFNSKIKTGYDERKTQIIHPLSESIWVHCASLGEYDMAIPILEELKKRKEKIVLTFFSPSGKEQVKATTLADYVYYIPYDREKIILDFIDKIKPKLVCFIKAEFWPNTMQVLSNESIPASYLSTVFRSSDYLFSSGFQFLESLLKRACYISTQDRDSCEVLEKHEFKNAEFTGNPRVDRIIKRKQNAKPIPLIEKWKDNNPTLVLGSSWEKEEELLYNFLGETKLQFKVIIAPHDISRASEIQEKFSQYGCATYTSIDNQVNSTDQVLILDTMGMLADVYQYADSVIVGGGFGPGIHNILEPSVYEIPVGIGPKFQKFPEAKELTQSEAISVIRNQGDLEKFINQSCDSEYRNSIAKKMHAYFTSNSGATTKIMRALTNILDESLNQ